MRIQLNGRTRELADGTTVADLIAGIAGAGRGSAAVVDGDVVPRSTWPTVPLRDGQVVELITAVQGG
jgi:sulfur carrier protein